MDYVICNCCGNQVYLTQNITQQRTAAIQDVLRKSDKPLRTHEIHRKLKGNWTYGTVSRMLSCLNASGDVKRKKDPSYDPHGGRRYVYYL